MLFIVQHNLHQTRWEEYFVSEKRQEYLNYEGWKSHNRPIHMGQGGSLSCIAATHKHMLWKTWLHGRTETSGSREHWSSSCPIREEKECSISYSSWIECSHSSSFGEYARSFSHIAQFQHVAESKPENDTLLRWTNGHITLLLRDP